MPLVTVKVLKGKTPDQKKALAKEITEAVVKNFEVPVSAVTIDIVDIKPEDLMVGGVMFTDR